MESTAYELRISDWSSDVFSSDLCALQEVRLAVVSTAPKGIVQITPETEIELRPEYEEPKEARRADVTDDELGGLGVTIDQIREMVELPLRYPALIQRLGVDPP